jgi:hypothetical protein
MKLSSVTFEIVHEDDENPAERLSDMIHTAFAENEFEEYIVTRNVEEE